MSNIMINIPAKYVVENPMRNIVSSAKPENTRNNKSVNFSGTVQKGYLDLGCDYAKAQQAELDLSVSKADSNIAASTKKTAPDNLSTVKYNIFNFVSEDLRKRRCESFLCPNSLSNVNYTYRNNLEGLLSDLDYELIEEVNNGFERIEPLDESLVVYRTVSGDSIDKSILEAKKGDVIVPDKGYAQVTPYPEMMQKYLPANKNRNPVIFEIECPKGSKVCIVPNSITGSGRVEGMMQGAAKYKVLTNEKQIYSYKERDFFSGEIKNIEIPITRLKLELIP